MGNFEILCAFSIFLLVLYRYFTMTFDFWKKRGISGPKPVLLFGTMKNILFKNVFIGKYVKDLYDAYENAPFIGIFKMREPILIIKDPKFMRDVLIKDSSIFYNREKVYFQNADPFYHFLFFNTGLTAQLIRTKISPAFTPSKIKNMFYFMLGSLERLDDYLEKLLSEDDCVNCKDLAARLTADMISRFIGINMDTLAKKPNEENNFLKYSEGQRAGNWKGKVKFAIIDIVPQLYKLFGYYLFDNDKITQFYTNITVNAMEQRKNDTDSKCDFINLLLEMKENPGQLAELTDVTDQFLTAQLHGFFFAGHDTSSITITNTLYELALNQNIQDKLREEIRNIYKKNQKLQYESINEMLYLDAVFKETLRKYPVAPIIERISTSSYTFGETNLNVPQYQRIIVPVYAIHHDPKIYPNPEIYDPERFTKEAIQSRNAMHYIPFGHGARYCMGERLGIFQTKLAIISILQKYKIDVCEKTITSYVFHPSSVISFSDKPIFLKITKMS